MADYRVDLPGLQRLIDGAQTLETTIENRIAEVEKRIDELHVNWSGEAAVSHRNAHNERVAAVAEMRAALQDLRNRLRTAHAAYSAVGPVNQGMWP
ncbi:WXG100 family type VII secretion target [Nocardia sp. NPDC127526]|uniref:WXG100 family type VII secretion target n=1 Tax=Nocardia sp. NPDC127526 TaxID=3345393 RepID=UPI0036443D3F